jgi:four helix bundle protein
MISPLQNRSLLFSARVLKIVKLLPRHPATRNIVEQLVKSGTSVGANVHEAQSAESRADLIHKMQISLKEARETMYWLALIRLAEWNNSPLMEQLCRESGEITAILAKSVITAKRNGIDGSVK